MWRCQFPLRVLLVFLFMAAGTRALAQPAPLPGPADCHDLGDLSIGQDLRSADIPIAAGQAVWFRFRLTEGITPSSWLDIDTARSRTTAGGNLNTEICLYDARANRLWEDDWSGGGTYNDSKAAALSIGGGSGMRLGEDGPGWVASRISDGWNRVNGDAPNLFPDVYYIVVVGYNADFSQDPNPNWQVSTNSTEAGTVRLRLRTGTVPADSWNERHHGLDAGQTLDTAHVVSGAGPLRTILCAGGVNLRDMFKINICDPGQFSATITPTASWGRTYRFRAFLFDAEGHGVVAINNTVQATPTVLTVPLDTPPGDYYIAVNNYCDNTVDPSAFDTQGRPIWSFAGSGTWNTPLLPNGTGAQGALGGWGRMNNNCEGADVYVVRIDLAGACHVDTTCEADFNGDGQIDFFDYLDFVLAYDTGC